MKDRFNALYDPKQANNVCVNGQLLLLDLIEKVEPYCELIQSNTDGILVKVENEEKAKIVEAVSQEWSLRTRMELEYERVVKIHQKDVNNYLLVTDEGKVKSKGAFAKDWRKDAKDKDGNKIKVEDYTDYDLVILREALHNFLVEGTPVRKTIMDCTDLRKFQKIVMVSSKYSHALHGKPVEHKYKEAYTNKWIKKMMPTEQMRVLKERHLRVFASTFEGDGGIYKVHAQRGNINKVGDTPDKAFIVNEDITNKTTNDFLELDKEWYIKLAEKRIKGYISDSKLLEG
jgi:DNA polymerase